MLCRNQRKVDEYCSVKGCINPRVTDCPICKKSRCLKHMTDHIKYGYRLCITCYEEQKHKG